MEVKKRQNAAVDQVLKAVRNSRHEDSAPVNLLLLLYLGSVDWMVG